MDVQIHSLVHMYLTFHGQCDVVLIADTDRVVGLDHIRTLITGEQVVEGDSESQVVGRLSDDQS